MEDEQWNLIAGKWGATDDDKKEGLAKLAVDGHFLEVLSSPLARRLLSPFAREVASLGHSLQALQNINLQLGKEEESSVDTLAIAVASLHVFIQLNWTGPDLPTEFSHPVAFLRKAVPDAFPSRSLTSDDDQDSYLDSTLQQACLEELTWSGEPAYHLCQSPFFLLFALRLLQSLPNDLITVPWWRLRGEAIHSRVLDTPVISDAALFNSLQSIVDKLTHLQGTSNSSKEEQRYGALLARLYTDHGLALQRGGSEKEANELFVKAAAANKLQYEVTGSLGKKTKFQKVDKTILVLLAESTLTDEKGYNRKDIEQSETEEEYDKGPSALGSNNNSGWKAGPSANQEVAMPSQMNHNDDTLLEQTRFTSTNGAALTHLDASKPTPLHPLDSSILLALSLNINNTSPQNGLTASQISAFVSRVLAHARNWSVHTMALLLRSRLEANRTRTAERSVLQLQALLDQMPTSDSTLQDRLLFFHELELPSKWDMQAELAQRYAALGVIKSALEIFERIEMWEEAVQCWGALGRQDRGIEVVQDLLQGRKVESSQVIQERKSTTNQKARMSLNKSREAKLWCLLGDLELEKAEEHYKKAWQVSLQRSARAARSLGGLYFAKSDYQPTILWLRRALQVNPLYIRSWFVLGCAYMRLDSAQGFLEAARCFRRCTSLDDEDGESWNNLASCYLRLSQQGRGALYDAHLSENGDNIRDADEVLRGVQNDDVDGDSLHSRDSGVVVVGSSDTDTEDEEETTTSTGGGGSTAFDVKLLAHRALTKSLRFSHDDWRIWNNYMIVSVDCGLMGEAVRAMTRIVELRASRASITGNISNIESVIDVPVLNRLVDAVTRAPSKEEEAIEDSNMMQGKANHSPHEGHGLYPSLSTLFTQVILPRVSSSAGVYKAYARLLFWRRLFRSALEAHLNAWRVSFGSDANIQVKTEKAAFLEAVEELRELCEILENFGQRPVAVDADGVECEEKGLKQEDAMSKWKFRARSLIRSFMGRTKDSFEGEPEWDNLLALRDSISK